MWIYILKLTKNKYYVGKTNNPRFRLDDHFNKDGSSWTKKFKPLQIQELIPDCDAYDEDKWTIKYMKNPTLNHFFNSTKLIFLIS